MSTTQFITPDYEFPFCCLPTPSGVCGKSKVDLFGCAIHTRELFLRAVVTTTMSKAQHTTIKRPCIVETDGNVIDAKNLRIVIDTVGREFCQEVLNGFLVNHPLMQNYDGIFVALGTFRRAPEYPKEQPSELANFTKESWSTWKKHNPKCDSEPYDTTLLRELGTLWFDSTLFKF
jgi:hypothetical protein